MLIALLMLFDSITVYTQALEVISWYKDHGYAIEAYYEVEESPWAVMDRAVGRFYENVEEGKYRMSNGKYVDWSHVEDVDNWYRISFSKNEFHQRDPSTAYVNPDAPFQYFDRRIRPNKIVRLYGFGKPPWKEYFGDIVFVYTYEKPPDKFIPTPKQKQLMYFLNGDQIDKSTFERIIENGVDTISVRKNLNFKLNGR